MDTVRSVDGDTIEMIVFNHYGRQTAQLLDEVFFADGNEALPRSGVFLEPGTVVYLPEDTQNSETKQLERLQNLWD